MKKGFIFILIVIFFSGFVLINQFSEDSAPNINSERIKHVKIAGQKVQVELASTPEKLARGLSGRQSLHKNEGMLFVFDHLDRFPFWMKDMNFPIDIIWIGEDWKVVYIKKDARPESYPETYHPESAGKYVLEVVSGFADKNNLKEGDQIELLGGKILK